jgi:4'-phosphopantetheinyl transferase
MDAAWGSPPESPALGAGEAHVWRARLDAGPHTVAWLAGTLSADERERAARFRFEKDRVSYTVARGVLRAILGRYLNVTPAELRFAYSPHGKPSLDGALRSSPLRFNVSHSHGLALYAFTSGREVGVDVEHVRPDFAGEQIAEHFFSRGEVTSLRGLPREARLAAFFHCWTRKESYIKARGEGLSHPLELFDVSMAPGEPAALLATRPDPLEATRWSLAELPCDPGYVASLAVEGAPPRLTLWRWDW